MSGWAIILGIIIAVAITKAAQVSRVYPVWARTAGELGLEISSKQPFWMPSITGEVDGIGVKVGVRHGGKNQPDYTGYEVTHVAYGPPVSIHREHKLSRVATMFGRADVELGDPFFDDRVVINTVHDDEIRAFLNPARQAAIMQLFDRYLNCQMTHDTITAETKSIQIDAGQLQGAIRRLVDIAKVMGDPGPVEEALVQQQSGQLAEAATTLHVANEQQSNLFVETLEAETLIELGDHEHAAEIFESVDRQLTDATPTDGWEALAAAPAPVTLPAPPMSGTLDLSQQSVIDDLFTGTRLSYQIVERFETTYVGASVAWTGTVTSFNSFRHDSDFGKGPGHKAIVLLGGAGRSELISNEVHAVVDLPASVDLTRGHEIGFSGTLLRVDRFARKIYVADAQLTTS